MNFIGIDPGQDGAVAIIDYTGVLSFYRTKEQDESCSRVTSVLADYASSSIAAIENIHGSKGWGNDFGLGFGVGYWHGICDMGKIPITPVYPRVWQEEMTSQWINKDLFPENISKKEKNKLQRVRLKKASIDAASALFPGKFITNDGVADAINIAEWLRRQYSK